MERREEKIKAYGVLAGKPEGKRPLEKSSNRMCNKANKDVKTHKLRWSIIDSVGTDEGEMADSCDHDSEQQGSIKCGGTS